MPLFRIQCFTHAVSYGIIAIVCGAKASPSRFVWWYMDEWFFCGCVVCACTVHGIPLNGIQFHYWKTVSIITPTTTRTKGRQFSCGFVNATMLTTAIIRSLVDKIWKGRHWTEGFLQSEFLEHSFTSIQFRLMAACIINRTGKQKAVLRL